MNNDKVLIIKNIIKNSFDTISSKSNQITNDILKRIDNVHKIVNDKINNKK